MLKKNLWLAKHLHALEHLPAQVGMLVKTGYLASSHFIIFSRQRNTFKATDKEAYEVCSNYMYRISVYVYMKICLSGKATTNYVRINRVEKTLRNGRRNIYM